MCVCGGGGGGAVDGRAHCDRQLVLLSAQVHGAVPGHASALQQWLPHLLPRGQKGGHLGAQQPQRVARDGRPGQLQREAQGRYVRGKRAEAQG